MTRPRTQIRRGIQAALAVALLAPLGAAADQYVFDSTPPKLKVTGKDVQRLRKTTVAKFKVACNETCRPALTGDAVIIRAEGSGKRSELRLKRDSVRRVKPGERKILKLKTTTRKAAAKIRQALKAGAQVRVEARVRVEDEVGNPAKVYRRVMLRL